MLSLILKFILEVLLFSAFLSLDVGGTFGDIYEAVKGQSFFLFCLPAFTFLWQFHLPEVMLPLALLLLSFVDIRTHLLFLSNLDWNPVALQQSSRSAIPAWEWAVCVLSFSSMKRAIAGLSRLHHVSQSNEYLFDISVPYGLSYSRDPWRLVSFLTLFFDKRVHYTS